jgi:hypothetical protein
MTDKNVVKVSGMLILIIFGRSVACRVFSGGSAHDQCPSGLAWSANQSTVSSIISVFWSEHSDRRDPVCGHNFRRTSIWLGDSRLHSSAQGSEIPEHLAGTREEIKSRASFLTRNERRSMAKLIVALILVGAIHSQPPTPQSAIQTVSVTFSPDMVRSVTVRVHNKGNLDITHLSGMLTYTPYRLAAVQTRCSTTPLLFERYVFWTSPKLQNVTPTTNGKTPAEKGTLNSGEDLNFSCGVQPPTKIQTAEFAPDTVIYADQTWSGDQSTSMSAFRERKQAASDYAKLMLAVTDAEKAPDPAKRYQEILAEWLPKTGITETRTATSSTTVWRPTKEFPSVMPYRRLQDYYGQYVFAAREKDAATQKGQPTGTVQQIAKPYIELMKRRDIALGVAYHIHSEAK